MLERRERSSFIFDGYTSAFAREHCRPSRTTGQVVKCPAQKSTSFLEYLLDMLTHSSRLNPPTTTPSQDDSAHATQSTQTPPVQSTSPHQQAVPPIPPPESLVHPPQQGSYGYPVYGHPLHPLPRGMQPPTAAPPQSWQAPNAIAPQQTHMPPPQPPGMLPRPPHPYRDGPWVAGFDQPQMVGGPSNAPFDYRYRDDQPGWVPPPGDFSYDPATVGTLTCII